MRTYQVILSPKESKNSSSEAIFDFIKKLNKALQSKVIRASEMERSTIAGLESKGSTDPSKFHLILTTNLSLNIIENNLKGLQPLNTFNIVKISESKLVTALSEKLGFDKGINQKTSKTLLKTEQKLSSESTTTPISTGSAQEFYSERLIKILDPKRFAFPSKILNNQSRVSQIFRNKFQTMHNQMQHCPSNLDFRECSNRGLGCGQQRFPFWSYNIDK